MRKLNRVTRLLGVIVAASLLAAACAPAPTTSPPTAVPAAATAVPPTLVPTAAPPTAVPATATAVPPTLAPTAVPPTLAPTTDALALLKTFQDAFNKGDTDGLMALFAAEPSLTLIAGLFGGGNYGVPAATAKGVRNTLEIGFKLNSQLTASDCSTKNNKATCALAIKDDCNPPTATPYHIRAQFTLTDGKIASVYGRWDQSEDDAYAVYNSARQDWARQNLTADAAVYAAYNTPSDSGIFPGLAPGETASEYGQAVERICKGYTAAGH